MNIAFQCAIIGGFRVEFNLSNGTLYCLIKLIILQILNARAEIHVDMRIENCA